MTRRLELSAINTYDDSLNPFAKEEDCSQGETKFESENKNPFEADELMENLDDLNPFATDCNQTESEEVRSGTNPFEMAERTATTVQVQTPNRVSLKPVNGVKPASHKKKQAPIPPALIDPASTIPSVRSKTGDITVNPVSKSNSVSLQSVNEKSPTESQLNDRSGGDGATNDVLLQQKHRPAPPRPMPPRRRVSLSVYYWSVYYCWLLAVVYRMCLKAGSNWLFEVATVLTGVGVSECVVLIWHCALSHNIAKI